ncbi:MAG: beta-lactamase family protein [Myxococcales bacterium]|nr:beta-lactamase family protein [Myxococcales bacterium]
MSAIDSVLAEAVAKGDPPAAQCCVTIDGAVVHESAHGCALDAVFDVASVTKILATTSALALLIERGEVELDDPVGRFLPARFDATLRALLGHRSGLPAWKPFFASVMADPATAAVFTTADVDESVRDAARAKVVAEVLATPLEHPGRRVYSDLGFIALGAVVEAVTTQRLDRFCADALFAGRDLGFVALDAPSPFEGRAILPTGWTRPREPAPGQEGLFPIPPQPRVPDAGRVDDDNAFAMGGVAGHAGVFGTARSLARFAHDHWVEDAFGATKRAFLAIDPADGPPRALGFDVPTEGSSAGALARGSRVFGHLGFTGCSLWMDLDRRLVAVLLTNRTFPGRAGVAGIRALRPAFHDAVAGL